MNSSNKLNKCGTKPKDIFKIVKSDFFLRKLFNNLLKKKSLDIIKYNNNIKDRMSINVKDYKEYSGIYSSIEIEIKPVNNKFGKFININKDKEYYHIYFNDNKEEIKRNYLNENENVEKIKIIIDYQIKSFYDLFENCKCIEHIYFKKFYRNNINNMRFMFYGCSSLKELNLSNFNTINVIDMRYMFSGCSSLKQLNLSKFNTNNVNNMRHMFSRCSSLEKLNLSNFDINYATNVKYMFEGCSEQFKNQIRARYKNIKEEAFNGY